MVWLCMGIVWGFFSIFLVVAIVKNLARWAEPASAAGFVRKRPFDLAKRSGVGSTGARWAAWEHEVQNMAVQQQLVGGLEHFLFSHILGKIIPIDFHIFQNGWPTHQPENEYGAPLTLPCYPHDAPMICWFYPRIALNHRMFGFSLKPIIPW